jgi:hypothetical protein
MSTSEEPPVPYRVVYSEFVRASLKDLLARAAARGLSRDILAAVKEFDSRLRIYPQFGQPLRDLKTEGETLWTGTVAPLVLQYVIDDEIRLVFVVNPFKTLPGIGL